MLNKNYNPYYLSLKHVHIHPVIVFLVFEYLRDQSIHGKQSLNQNYLW